MQFTTFVLLSALVASVASVAHAALSAARRANDDVIASVWTDANQGGQQKNISANAPPLACMDFADPFQDSISSLSVNDSVLCTFFRDFGCGGPSFKVGNLFVANLTDPFDNEISAVSCDAL